MDFEKQIKWTNEKNLFMSHNHIRLTEMQEDYAVVELSVVEESHNLFGGIHGGALFTMADCAAGTAARSRGMQHVTLNNSFSFYSGTNNPFLRCIAKVKKRGRTICVAEVDIRDGADKLIAGGTFTMFATGVLEGG